MGHLVVSPAGDHGGGGGVMSDEPDRRTEYPPVMTADDVAELLACGRTTVAHLPIRWAKIGGKRLYLFRDVLDYVKRERDAA